ncbi:MAG: ATP synthase F1 subunit gamma [Polyangiales bacterium]
MPSLKVIRRRIASVKNTQKITRAMKMVAAARLRRAQQRITELRPYALKTVEVLRSVAGGADGSAHPLLDARPVKRVLLVVMTSDRGLAGAFNAAMTRAAMAKHKELQEQGHEVALAVIGRKGRDFFKRRGYDVAMEYTGLPEGDTARSDEVARALMDAFTSGDYDQVILAFSEFKSAISQKPAFLQVLPIDAGSTAAADDAGPRTLVDMIYEPSRDALLASLLPMYVKVSVYRALLESNASEHGARMTAMDNATNNAKKMIGSLTLQYNRARQAAITKELMEIIGGAEAIKD